MPRRRNRSILFAATFAALALSGVSAPHVLADASGLFGSFFSDLNLVSREQEAQIASQLARQVESEHRVVRDRDVQDFVSDVGNRLAGSLRGSDFRYTFRVVADPSVNAFGIGGGRIYVNVGLLAAADTEGQVAAVVAHEIGHQVKRHVAKQISRQAVLENLARVAIGRNASQWIQLAAGLGVTTGQLYFGREAEREADVVMVDLLPRAGYDPHEALAMFAKLRALEGRDPNAVSALFSAHPPTSERSEAVRRRIASMRVPSGLARDSRRFQDLRHRVVAALRR